jgi:hypothetical protein
VRQEEQRAHGAQAQQSVQHAARERPHLEARHAQAVREQEEARRYKAAERSCRGPLP